MRHDLDRLPAGRPVSSTQPSTRHRRTVTALKTAAAASVAAVALAACSSAGGKTAISPPVSPPAQLTNYHGEKGILLQQLRNDAARLVVDIARAPASSYDESEIAAAENGFAVSLTRELYSENGPAENVLTSPLSADAALSMLLPGTEGSTFTALTDGLDQAHLSAAALSSGWSTLLTDLGRDLGPAAMNVADSAWMQPGIVFEHSYLDSIARTFGETAYQANFAGDLNGAIAAINGWVSSETGGRIRQIVNTSNLSPQTILVLANALHFRDRWASSLDFQGNESESFHSAAGETVTVPSMSDQSALEVAADQGYAAVELPYAGGRFSALLVEPSGSMKHWLAGLSAGEISTITSSLRSRTVLLSLPTLTLENNFSMRPVLSSLGMGRLFSRQADLSGISPEAADVSSVQQANRLVLTSWGTDFASATVVGAAGSAAPLPAPRVTIDRPFLLLIRDGQTGAVVASAVVDNPLAG